MDIPWEEEGQVSLRSELDPLDKFMEEADKRAYYFTWTRGTKENQVLSIFPHFHHIPHFHLQKIEKGVNLLHSLPHFPLQGYSKKNFKKNSRLYEEGESEKDPL